MDAIYHPLGNNRKPSTGPFPQLGVPDVGPLHQLRTHFQSRNGDQDRGVRGDKSKKRFSWLLMNLCTAVGSGTTVGSCPCCNEDASASEVESQQGCY